MPDTNSWRSAMPNRSMASRFVGWFFLFLLATMVLRACLQAGEVKTIPYSAFKQDVAQGRVAEVRFQGDRISGVFAQAGENADRNPNQNQGTSKDTNQNPNTTPEKSPGGNPQPTRFETVKPAVADPQLMDLLEQHDVTVRAESTRASMWVLALVNLLPWVLLLGVGFFIVRRMQQGFRAAQGGPFGFARSPAKRFEKASSDVTFRDVAGLEAAKADLREIIGYLREPGHYQKLGAKIPRGVLLMGPPGIGKTLLAKAVAGEANTPFFSIGGSEFIQMFVGVGASRVRDLFETAKKDSPAIIFIDELDAIGRTRGSGLGGGNDEREQTLNQILSEMDGFSPLEAVVVIAATNRPDVLDPALLRPGRFDRKIALQMPDKRARQQILAVHTRKVPLAEDIDLAAVAARTVGFAGADLENLVNEAALGAARNGKDRVDMASLAEARDKILLGAAREIALTDEQKKLVAYHEAGHALLALLLPNADPLEKVTIIPRGRALGVTSQMPDEDRLHLKESYLRERIEVMLGGRVSEKLVYGEVTSGSEEDLKQATQLARRMVSQWGMSDKLGAVAFKRGEQHVFLGQELAQERDFSERTAQLIDDEIRHLVGALERDAQRRLEEHRAKLDAIARALVEHETLNGEEMRALLHLAPAGARPAERRKNVPATQIA